MEGQKLRDASIVCIRTTITILYFSIRILRIPKRHIYTYYRIYIYIYFYYDDICMPGVLFFFCAGFLLWNPTPRGPPPLRFSGPGRASQAWEGQEEPKRFSERERETAVAREVFFHERNTWAHVRCGTGGHFLFNFYIVEANTATHVHRFGPTFWRLEAGRPNEP